ncbi:MAG: GHKL domain-containing protein [Rhodospirillales bacterium]|nr:GHKL domain-containing protein [Rhodospirillales bacterium]
MFDLGTLLLALTVVELVMAAVLLLFAATGQKVDGIVELALALLVGSLGCLAAAAAAATRNPLLLYIASVSFVVIFVMMARAMRRLQGEAPRKRMEAAIVLIALALDGWFVLGSFNVVGMFVVNSALFAVITALTAADLLAERRAELRPGCRVLGLLFVVFSLFMVFRALVRPFIENNTGPFPQVTLIDLIAGFVSIAAAIVWTVGFLWTVCSRSAYRLKRANADLERFSGAVAHDLKAPLNSIIGFLGIMKKTPGGIADAEALEYLDSATAAAWRMNEFIDDLLERAVGINTNQAFSSVDTAECSRDAEKNLHSQLARTGGIIATVGLPTVLGSKAQLTRLFQNLYDNALKYRSPDRQPVITVTATAQNDGVAFSISDNGLGIPAEAQQSVFNYMERGGTANGESGSGVGLAECKRIVESHGGAIWVESGIGGGSVFHFTVKQPAVQSVSLHPRN